MLSYSNIPDEFGDPTHSARAGIDARMVALGIAHCHLDAAIDALAGANSQDGLALVRLKKQRLRIRDKIAGMLGSNSGGAHG